MPRFPLARFLLARFLCGPALESVEGDLDEEYTQHIRPARGRLGAWLWYWRQTLRSIRDRRQGTDAAGTAPANPSPPRHAMPWRLHARYALRSLVAAPASTALAVLTIALGIGASLAVFSVINVALLRPLPYGQADRIVMVWDSNPARGFPTMGPTPANFLDWQARSGSFERLAPLAPYTATLTGAGDVRRLQGQRVGWQLFELLQAPVALGRWFREDEDAPGNSVAIISHRLWTDALGADAAIVGRRLLLDGRPRTVVGVMPRGFRLPPLAWAPEQIDDVWVPMGFTAQERTRRGSHYLSVIGRLRAGVSREQAQREMDGIAATLAETYPRTNTGLGAIVRSVRDQFTAELRPPMRLFAWATALLLAIASLNVANLLVGRGAARTREMAVRAALGASRGQLTSQLLIEGAVVAVAGGIAGIVLASTGLRGIVAQAPAGLLPLAPVALDWRVALYATLATACVAVVCGLAPLVHLRRLSDPAGLRDGTRGPGTAGTRLRHGLVVAQIALACVMLVTAGLLLRSFSRLVAIDPGFHPAGVLAIGLELPRTRYRGPAEWQVFFEDVLGRLSSLPDVESAGGISWLPLTTSGNSNAIFAEHQPPPAPGETIFANYRLVTPGYFEAIGIPVREGRGFTPGDSAAAPRVTVINQTMARRLWPDRSAIGKRVTFRPQEIPSDDASWMTVVGVVADARQGSLSDAVTLEMFAPYLQEPNWFPPNDLVIRTAGNPAALAPLVRRAVAAVDPAVPVTRTRTMVDVINSSVATPRFVLLLIAALAVTAVTLAVVGIYGLMAFAVHRRTREIGLRTALGARPGSVLGLVMRQGAWLVVPGALLGCGGALAATRLVRSQLHDITPTDPLTFVVVPLVLAGVALIACYIPARRAVRIQPTEALRQE